MPAAEADTRRAFPGWAPCALLLCLVTAAYWPCLRGGMLWDDQAHVTREDLRPVSGLVRIWTHLNETQQYYPVLHSAFWIEHRLWGDSTLGYHLANLALHAIDACLFAAVLSRLGGMGAGPRPPPGAAWLAAFLFALHPVCVESVAWISEQKNTLSLALYLLSARAYLGFSGSRSRAAYAAAFALFCAALGTKSVTATLPAALLVALGWRNGSLSWRRDVAPLAPWFLVAGASGMLTAWVERHVVGAEGPAFAITAAGRLLVCGRAIWFYLGKLAWPADLMFIYPRWDLASWGGAAWAFPLSAAAVTACLWVLRGRLRGACAAWLFYVGSLFPALGFFNIFPFLYSYVADHFQYLPSLGIFAACAIGAARTVERLPPAGRGLGRAACALVVGCLALLTRAQSTTYRDSETLYRSTLAKNPSCWMAEGNLAAELADAGRTGEALQHFRRALEVRPDYPEAHNNLANLLSSLPGRGQEAAGHYAEALRLKPGFTEAHVGLANLLSLAAGREAEAASHYEEALRLNPGDPTVRYDLAGLLARVPGREGDAIAQYRESLRLRPGSAETHSNLGVLLSRSPGTAAEALAEFAEAARLDPGFAAAHVNLALLYLGQGRAGDASRECRLALRIDPNDPTARRILSQLGEAPGR